MLYLKLKQTSKIIIVFVLFLLYGCKKEVKTDNDTKTTSDVIWATIVYNDVFTQIDAIFKNNVLLTKDSITSERYGCVVVSKKFDTIFPKIYLLDFGGSNCQGSDSRYRRGRIYLSFSNYYSRPGTIVNVSFVNYYVNDCKVEGAYSIQVEQNIDLSENIIYNIRIQGGSILTSTGRIFYSGTFAREFVGGQNTEYPILNDDVYQINSLSVKGTSANVEDFTAVLGSPLKYYNNCGWFIGGVLLVNIYSREQRVVTFNSNICSNIANVNISGKDYSLTLR